MTVKAYFRGHEAYYDDVIGVWRYLDDGTAVSTDPFQERPCAHCHLPPTPAGHDGCLGYIPGAISACCGHGVEQGYIVWEESPDNGAAWSLTTDKLLLGTAVAIFLGWALAQLGRGVRGQQ